jgi:hypothetical protein
VAAAAHPATGLIGCRVVEAQEPNQTFEQAMHLAPGALTTGPQSFGDGGLGITYPDTMLGFYSDTTFSVLVRRNNDSMPIGDGRGSMIPTQVVNRDGSIPLAVSGFADLNFDGLDDTTGQAHSQAGNVELTLRVWDTGPTTVPFAEHVMDLALTPGEVSMFDFADESWIGHTFTAIVDNTIDGGNDVDFWRFTGLTPGAMFNARTAATTSPQGSIMRIYDTTTGSVLADSIDAQEDCPVGLCGTVSQSGEVVVALTGYDDFDFLGAHGALGDYTLNLLYEGDTDLDGDVDGDDLANLLVGFGTTTGAALDQGDVDFDDDVDRDDLAIWRLNAGAGSPGGLLIEPPMVGPSAGVPEPSTVAMLGVVLALAYLTRSQRRRQRGILEPTLPTTCRRRWLLVKRLAPSKRHAQGPA